MFKIPLVIYQNSSTHIFHQKNNDSESFNNNKKFTHLNMDIHPGDFLSFVNLSTKNFWDIFCFIPTLNWPTIYFQPLRLPKVITQNQPCTHHKNPELLKTLIQLFLTATNMTLRNFQNPPVITVLLTALVSFYLRA